jgi:hypothetical protein
MAREIPVNARVNTPTAAPPDAFNIPSPSPTPGFSGHNAGGMPNPAPPGFMPRQGEGNAAARTRVIDTVLNVARSNGAEPADNG